MENKDWKSPHEIAEHFSNIRNNFNKNVFKEELEKAINIFLKKYRYDILIAYHESQTPNVRESHSKYINKCVNNFLKNFEE
jgi:spore coat protein CotF